MDEYIYKQELLRDLERKIKQSNEYKMAVVDSDFIDLVNDATVLEDVVEVVRCKNCKYAKMHVDIIGEPHLFCCNGKSIYRRKVDFDDFCSYGERKEK